MKRRRCISAFLASDDNPQWVNGGSPGFIAIIMRCRKS
jgi:hypothetical protein